MFIETLARVREIDGIIKTSYYAAYYSVMSLNTLFLPKCLRNVRYSRFKSHIKKGDLGPMTCCLVMVQFVLVGGGGEFTITLKNDLLEEYAVVIILTTLAYFYLNFFLSQPYE